jgi:tetratricopeptide (TPR) repeat protein
VPRTPGTPPPAVPGGPSIPAGMQRLEPPRKKGETLVATVDAPPRRKLPLIAGGAGAVVIAGALAFVFGRGGGSDGATAALAPFAGDLQRDHYPAYQKAAEALMAGSEAQASLGRRGAAAELMLLAGLGHGDKSKITRGNELLSDLPAGEPPAELLRAKALLSVARGRGSEIDTQLGTQASAPEANLIKGMRRLRERRAADALAGLKAYVAAAPDRVLGQYLLARAMEETRNPQADAAYGKVLAANPEHAGALVGRLRLGKGTPAQRQVAAKALLAKLSAAGSPAEVGEAETVLGEALLAQGQTAAALEVLGKAVVATPSDPAAQAAMTEALLAEGRSSDALTRLRALEPVVLANAPGRLAMGAALVSTGAVSEGTAQIEAAAAELPKNPRALTWLAAAAENRKPADEATAVKRYKEALELDPRFLPASLRLAALLQRKGKATEAIALIKQAEEAGAPSEALSVAWGQALIGAKDYAQAELVLRKAVATSPALVGARTGLAAALEAAGKADDAEKELERAIADLPKAAGLRERLAELYARNGKRERALEALEDERKAGRSTLPLQVQIAQLALQLGQPDRAIKELEAVVNEDPATPGALFALGRSREAARDLSGALQDYKRALAFETSPELHLAYGRALAQTGRDDEALSQLESAGEVALARLERARIRLKRNEVDEALKEVEAATRLAPGDGRAFFMQGICLDLVGRADDAAAAWKKALAATPDLAEAHYRLGRYEMDKGRQESALTHFRAAAAKPLDKVAWEADLYFQLGFAEAAAGVRGNAMTALRRYLEISAPDAPARPEAEQQLARLGRR